MKKVLLAAHEWTVMRMPEYIEREAVIKHLQECEGTPPEIGYTYLIFKAIECFVEELPAADVVPVVRCEKCHYWDKTAVNGKGFRICPASGMDITPHDFCSYGERKEDVNA